MNQESWQAIKDLFGRVRELPEGQRDNFLKGHARTHSDDEPVVVSEVRRLLQSDLSARDFLEPPTSGPLEKTLRLSFDFRGQRLGEFELVREIGRGSSGIVYLGRQENLARDVAIKILAPHLCASQDHRERFEREALAASKVRHPNVVSMLSFGEQDGAYYLVMEYVRGRSLYDELEHARRVRGSNSSTAAAEDAPNSAAASSPPHQDVTDPYVAARLFQSLAHGLEACHRAGVTHRDIKPQNILIDEQGEPRLVDFGLALDGELDPMSRTGALSGTPYYMSPEQARAAGREIDSRTDIYSMGAVLYEMLSLERPFEGTGATDVFQRILNDRVLPVHHRNPAVPRSLAAICMKALHKKPDQRYASARELALDLREFLAGRVVVANLRWVVEDRATALVRRNPWVPAAAAVAAVAVLIALAPSARPKSPTETGSSVPATMGPSSGDLRGEVSPERRQQMFEEYDSLQNAQFPDDLDYDGVTDASDTNRAYLEVFPTRKDLNNALRLLGHEPRAGPAPRSTEH